MEHLTVVQCLQRSLSFDRDVRRMQSLIKDIKLARDHLETEHVALAEDRSGVRIVIEALLMKAEATLAEKRANKDPATKVATDAEAGDSRTLEAMKKMEAIRSKLELIAKSQAEEGEEEVSKGPVEHDAMLVRRLGKHLDQRRGGGT